MTSKIILNANDSITCPHCDTDFHVKDAIAKHLIEQHENEYEQLLNQQLTSLKAQATKEAEKSASKIFQQQLTQLKEQLEDSKQSAEILNAKIESEKAKVEQRVREAVSLEQQSLEESIKSKNEQLDQFRNEELKLRKAKTELEDKQKNFELELARKVEEQKQLLRDDAANEFKLIEAEYRKKIDDASKANNDLKRKLEQGSQQLQGEVLELELETTLAQLYPVDFIEPVKKGAKGADVIQTVCMRSGTVCGKIVWETKRAENWSNAWVSKLKTDVQNAAGDIGVLVTTVFPANTNAPMLMVDGVWLVKPALAKGLSEALRIVLLESQRQKTVSAGKNEQMEAIYDYICSPQFVHRLKAVVDHQEQMKVELDKERNAMQRIWKKREGQITGITAQMMSICGELQGLSHGGMPMLDEIAALE